jgi:hypothetical protein
MSECSFSSLRKHKHAIMHSAHRNPPHTWVLARNDPHVGLAWPWRAQLQQVEVMAVNGLTNHQQLHPRLGLPAAAAAAAAVMVSITQSRTKQVTGGWM